MTDHLRDATKMVADSDDIRIGAAMVDAQTWKACGKPLDPDSQLPAIFERLKEYASRLEAVEKDEELQSFDLDVELDELLAIDRSVSAGCHPDTDVDEQKQRILTMVRKVFSLVPTLSPDKE